MAETPTTESTDQEAAEERPFSLLETLYDEPESEDKPSEEVEEPEPEAPETPEEEPEEEVDKPESSGDEEEETSKEDDEGETISSVSELIETNEYDPEWFDSLKVAVKVDGEPADVPIKDLVANYQMNTAADKRFEEAKAKREALTKEFAEKSQAIEQEYAVVANIIQQTEEILNQDTSAIDWNSLRADDPAEYSAKKAEIAERRQQVERLKSDAREKYNAHVDQINQQQRQQFQERLPQEQEALYKKLPEWRDPKTAKDENAKLTSYLANEGFAPEEISQAIDHRLIVLAHKARLYDEGQKKVGAAKKRVAKVPKVVKPGAKKSPEKPKPKNAAEILYGTG